MKKIFIIVSVFFSSIISLQATEIDSFTGSPHLLKNSISTLNAEVNARIYQAYLSLSDFSCSNQNFEQQLHEAVKYQIIGGAYGEYLYSRIERFLDTSSNIEKVVTKPTESIYRDLPKHEYFGIFLGGLGAVFNFNNLVVGSDKIGHFFGTGLTYHREVYLNGKTIRDALEMGISYENGFVGKATTGVFSWGDLAANFNGLRFWRNLIHQDPITGAAPYIQCQNDKMVIVKRFKLENYMDPAWDERINKSTYRNQAMSDLIAPYTYEFSGQKSGCAAAFSKYAKIGITSYIISPSCR